MVTENQHSVSGRLAGVLRKLSASARRVAQGDYGASKHLFQVSGAELETPELRELAEILGLMSVKIEGREYHLEQILAELKIKNAELKLNVALRTESAFLFCSFAFLFFIYAIALAGMFHLGFNSAIAKTFMTAGLVAALLAAAGISVRRHHYPWAAWGFTWKDSRRALWESLLFGIPLALAAIALKWMIVQIPASPLFGHSIFEPFRPSFIMLATYAVGVIAQEIISRGFLQTSLERILTGKYKTLMAVLTASLLFAVAHLHYSISAVLATLLGGFFFGWLFYRHRTLVGVCVVHFLLGILLGDILGIIAM